MRSNLSLALGGLVGRTDLPVGGDPRSVIGWAGGLRCAGVQVDATSAGLRPRELDRSARRDLASVLRRHELALSGVDAFVPVAHLSDPSHQDRAVHAVVAAIELCSELSMLSGGGGSVVSVTLPEKAGADVLSVVCAAAERCGVVIADHRWPVVDRGRPLIGVGIDPSAVVLGGGVPSEAPLKVRELAAARVSDLAAQGRVAPGSGDGKMDLLAYRIALETSGFRGMPVMDLRGLQDPEKAAKGIVDGWGRR
jgi:sugar phosphate isomerase/epimerase